MTYVEYFQKPCFRTIALSPSCLPIYAGNLLLIGYAE